MRPMRGGDVFGRGGPLNVRSAAAKLALALIGVTVVTMLAGVAGLVALTPRAVFGSFALWQPLTYGFLETSPIGLMFGALIVWSMGSALEQTWGSKQFLLVSVVGTALAGVLTALLGLVMGSVYGMVYPGGTVLATLVWVAYGLSHGRGTLSFFGMPVTGNVFAAIGIGFVALNAVFARSIIPVVPEIFAILLVAAYVKVGNPSTLLLKLKHWRYQRELKSRSKHLNVVSGDRNGRGSDRYLQ